MFHEKLILTKNSYFNTLNLLAADELPHVLKAVDNLMFSIEDFSLENREVNAHSQKFLFLRGIHDSFVDKGVEFCCLFQASRLQ